MLNIHVDRLLAEYRTCAGRVAHLEVELKLIEAEMELIRSFSAEDEALKGRNYELMDMPKATSTGSIVESVALKYAAGFIPQDLLNLERRKRELEAELKTRRIGVVFVESWLKGLSERERWLVTEKYISKKQWSVLVDEYNEQFCDQVSRWTLKKLAERAVAMIYDMAA